MNGIHEHDSAAGTTVGTVLVVSSVRLLRDRVAEMLGTRGVRAIPVMPSQLPPEPLADLPAPDVAIVDARDMDAAGTVHQLTSGVPPVKVILLGASDDEQLVLRCIEAGATGYLDADCAEDDVVAVILRVRCDDVIVTPKVLAALMRRVITSSPLTPLSGVEHLTARERQVLSVMERGLSNKEIAGELHISVATVKHHVHRILEKLKVPRRSAAVAQLRGHLPPP
jgi:two-component system, NarL family, nitrate/nitrite response regulator NarL